MGHISLDENRYETLLPKNSHGSPNFDTAAYTIPEIHGKVVLHPQFTFDHIVLSLYETTTYK